jgi:hypothetical protein
LVAGSQLCDANRGSREEQISGHQSKTILDQVQRTFRSKKHVGALGLLAEFAIHFEAKGNVLKR